MSEVAWHVEGDGRRPVTDEAVLRAAACALDHGRRPGLELSIVFVDDATLAGMHARYLDDPTPTDVITFDLGEEGEGPAGELYVSLDRARAEAAERGETLERELLLYVVHGALHLCEFDDHSDDDRRAMRAAEAAVLARLGL